MALSLTGSNADHVDEGKTTFSGSRKTFKVTDALVFKSNLSSDPVPYPVAGRGVVLKESQSDNL